MVLNRLSVCHLDSPNISTWVGPRHYGFVCYNHCCREHQSVLGTTILLSFRVSCFNIFMVLVEIQIIRSLLSITAFYPKDWRSFGNVLEGPSFLFREAWATMGWSTAGRSSRLRLCLFFSESSRWLLRLELFYYDSPGSFGEILMCRGSFYFSFLFFSLSFFFRPY